MTTYSKLTEETLLSGVLFECDSCGRLFDQAANIPGAVISNYCPTCAGKVFMGQYTQPPDEAPTSGCCGANVDQMATLPLCVRCNGLLVPKTFQPFLGKHLPSHNDRCRMQEEPSVKELLELSTLYHNHIRELAELWNVSLTPATRAQAFQIVMNFGEQLKMKTLAAAVLSEINQKETNDDTDTNS